MASLRGNRFLFFTTSPRSPMKMVPEIELLGNLLEGKTWNTDSQKSFMEQLCKQDFFEGGSVKDLAFAARDRITRAPKSLGFVDLKPKIKISEAGKALLEVKNKEEVFLKQLLKFQLPSPYHAASKEEENYFFVKPYLEMFRLIEKFGSLSFDEMMMFGLQLTDYRKFDEIFEQIEQFRLEKVKTSKSYKVFKGEYLEKIIRKLFEKEIKTGKIKLRESDENNIKKFIDTKASTMRDYTDACFRYLRATGMVHLSQKGKSLSISPEKKKEVEFFLTHVDRNPCFINDIEKYKEYLFSVSMPLLYTDNKERLIAKIREYKKVDEFELETLSIIELKDLLFDLREKTKSEAIKHEIRLIKNYTKYKDIKDTFEDIRNKALYDNPLMLEWNVWRAMTMLNGGEIKANLKFDDSGTPLSTAQGNIADIVCDYEEFGLTVEVTMSSGARQYEMEGEPVARHLAKLKKETRKPAYCFFIAPKVHEACISYFYMLHKTKIAFYEGKSVIFPLELDVFVSMLEASYNANFKPEPEHLRKLFQYSEEVAEKANDEVDWYEKIRIRAKNWLS